MVDMARREMSTYDLMTLLRERYPKAEYAFFTEVANGTGFSANRHADALAMSLWPSRGLHLTGFELKVSRSDWIKELKNPEKAESIAQYCHYWYLVVASENIVQDGELPPNWGLLAPVKGKLKAIVNPALLTPKELTLPFIAALFRAAQNQISRDAQIATIRAQEYQLGVKAGQESRDYELQALRKRISTFEEKAGVLLTDYNHGSLTEAMRLVRDGLVGDVSARLDNIRDQAARIVAVIDQENKPPK